MKTITTSAQFYDSVDNGVVFIMFGAERCRYCRASKPVVDSVLAARYARLPAFWVDIDLLEDIARRRKIDPIPTFMLLRNGRQIARLEGQPTRAQFEKFMAGALS